MNLWRGGACERFSSDDFCRTWKVKKLEETKVEEVKTEVQGSQLKGSKLEESIGITSHFRKFR